MMKNSGHLKKNNREHQIGEKNVELISGENNVRNWSCGCGERFADRVIYLFSTGIMTKTMFVNQT